MNTNVYDLIIIGSGPAGLTAAIYATRANLKTLIIGGLKWGGQLMLTTEVENFPGFPEGIMGPDLMRGMRKQAEKFGAEFIEADMEPQDFTNAKSPFTVTSNGKEYTGKVLLIATGADAKTLGVPGEQELTGRGISYCATCDGAFFKNKDIIVVGGGDSAMEEAIFLTKFASSVTLVHRRDTFRASQIMQERVKKHEKINLLLNAQITEVIGEFKLEKVKIKIQPSDKSILSKSKEEIEKITPEQLHATVVAQDTESVTIEMPIGGVFVAIGHTPNTTVFKGVEVTEKGFVKAQENTHTNIKGIFVSGDVEDDRYMQGITAAGFGCQAALDIERYLRSLEE